ncbi:MAG TPA: hypothetical protein VEB19_07295 [Gemmatimonadaceae bacterium]|nr:hypothetical protein [Gemmatimonadaceae bacterium]
MQTTGMIPRTLAFGGAALLLAGCLNLEVDNPNAPTLEASLSTPANVELTAGSSFKYLWAQIQNDDPRQGVSLFPGVGLSGLADELTYADNQGQFQQIAGRPRMPFDNAFAGAWFTRMPMANYYTAINGCADVIRAIHIDGMKLGPISAAHPNGLNTSRATWFCKFVQGVGHIQLGILYDKALLVDDGIPFADMDIYSTDHRPPAEVIAHGMALLQEAIDSAKVTCTATPTPPCVPALSTPTTWANGVAYTNQDIIKLASSWKARAMLYGIRSDADWTATDAPGYWDRVIAYVDSGITSSIGGVAFSQPNGFVVQADNTIRGARTFTYATVSNNAYTGTGTPATNAGRISQEFLGPGDTTSAYLWWRGLSDAGDLLQLHDTTYESPDRRMPRFNEPLTSATATPIAGTGTYFGRLSNLFQATAANSPWANTRYYNKRFQGTSQYHLNGLVSTMRPAEMDLIKAEALIRRNGAGDIDAAATLINRTRVTNGGLTALPNGMTQTSLIPGAAPGNAGAACVPRSFRDPSQCGTIMDALLWEKRLENSGVESTINWADWRRFGMLREGSLISLPIHGRELVALGLPYYTYGGNTPGSVGVAGTAYVTRGAPGDGSSPAWIQ